MNPCASNRKVCASNRKVKEYMSHIGFYPFYMHKDNAVPVQQSCLPH